MMKLGILLCDQIQPALGDDFGDYPAMFNALLSKTQASNPQQVSLQFFAAYDGELPSHIDQCDGYMSSGSKFGVNDDIPWIRALEDFVRSLYHAKKGFVGICFGHQLIARALGGQVQSAAAGWGIGIASSKVLQQKNWMQPAASSLNLVVSHQDQISQLPKHANVLLSNPFCPYSMIQIDDHFLGLQGHPEFSQIYSYALMNSRRDRISAQTIRQAVLSLEQPSDDLLTMQWLLTFLQQAIKAS